MEWGCKEYVKKRGRFFEKRANPAAQVRPARIDAMMIFQPVHSLAFLAQQVL
jgi:hypothetical protein